MVLYGTELKWLRNEKKKKKKSKTGGKKNTF